MKNLIFRTKKYIYHQFSANSRYQLHSPFLFKLATEIFSGKTNTDLTFYYRQLTKIESSERNIISLKKAQVLSRLLVLIEPKTILYIGSSEANKKIIQATTNSKVISIETWSDFINLDEMLLDEFNTLDFVFSEGEVQVDKKKEMFDKCLEFKNNNSVFVFNKIHQTNAINEGWNYVKNHIKTIVSIDLFHMGIVLFRKEMSKQQIKYRY